MAAASSQTQPLRCVLRAASPRLLPCKKPEGAAGSGAADPYRCGSAVCLRARRCFTLRTTTGLHAERRTTKRDRTARKPPLLKERPQWAAALERSARLCARSPRTGNRERALPAQRTPQNATPSLPLPLPPVPPRPYVALVELGEPRLAVVVEDEDGFDHGGASGALASRSPERRNGPGGT